MTIDKIILIIYSIILMGGGYMGFKKGSMVSLGMGVGSGLIVLLGVWLISINPKGGWILQTFVSGFLATAFLIRLVKTHNFMPSGMLLILSLAVAIWCYLQITKQQ